MQLYVIFIWDSLFFGVLFLQFYSHLVPEKLEDFLGSLWYDFIHGLLLITGKNQAFVWKRGRWEDFLVVIYTSFSQRIIFWIVGGAGRRQKCFFRMKKNRSLCIWTMGNLQDLLLLCSQIQFQLTCFLLQLNCPNLPKSSPGHSRKQMRSRKSMKRFDLNRI